MMTNLKNSLIAIPFFLGTVLLPAQSEEPGTYCNETYHFCAHFPASFLPQQTVLPSKNGIELKTDDGRGIVTIGGYRMEEGSEPREIFNTRFENLEKKIGPDEVSSIVSSLFGTDFYESFFIAGRSYYYQKSYFFETYYVLLEVKIPVNKPDLMMLLREQVTLDFQPDRPMLEIGLSVSPAGM